jgi:glycosyltransferase involved in cell wall biosynthesis
MPNIDGIDWFVRAVYPKVKQACPHVTLDVVGRRPTLAVQALSQDDPTINVYGSVPDVRPYMATADVFIVPLRIGSGTRLKIFEAMATRLAVVSTTVGAEGLAVEHGRHLLLADSPEDFAESIVSLLNEPAQKQSMGDEGYDLVTQNYTWRSATARLHDLCMNLVESNRVTAAVR